jgi:hypothetical protein
MDSLKEHPYFKGYYGSKRGFIFDNFKSKIVTITSDRNNYQIIKLYDIIKLKFINYNLHKFIYECFTEKIYSKYQQFKHINGDKYDNSLHNIKLYFGKRNKNNKKLKFYK